MGDSCVDIQLSSAKVKSYQRWFGALLVIGAACQSFWSSFMTIFIHI